LSTLPFPRRCPFSRLRCLVFLSTAALVLFSFSRRPPRSISCLHASCREVQIPPGIPIPCHSFYTHTRPTSFKNVRLRSQHSPLVLFLKFSNPSISPPFLLNFRPWKSPVDLFRLSCLVNYFPPFNNGGRSRTCSRSVDHWTSLSPNGVIAMQDLYDCIVESSAPCLAVPLPFFAVVLLTLPLCLCLLLFPVFCLLLFVSFRPFRLSPVLPRHPEWCAFGDHLPGLFSGSLLCLVTLPLRHLPPPLALLSPCLSRVWFCSLPLPLEWLQLQLDLQFIS